MFFLPMPYLALETTAVQLQGKNWGGIMLPAHGEHFLAKYWGMEPGDGVNPFTGEK